MTRSEQHSSGDEPTRPARFVAVLLGLLGLIAVSAAAQPASAAPSPPEAIVPTAKWKSCGMAKGQSVFASKKPAVPCSVAKKVVRNWSMYTGYAHWKEVAGSGDGHPREYRDPRDRSGAWYYRTFLNAGRVAGPVQPKRIGPKGGQVRAITFAKDNDWVPNPGGGGG